MAVERAGWESNFADEGGLLPVPIVLAQILALSFPPSLLSSSLFCVVLILFARASKEHLAHTLMSECLLVLHFVEEMKTPI
jgi:hypothetical protein